MSDLGTWAKAKAGGSGGGWKEDDHPRDEKGQFSSDGGGGGGGGEKADPSALALAAHQARNDGQNEYDKAKRGDHFAKAGGLFTQAHEAGHKQVGSFASSSHAMAADAYKDAASRAPLKDDRKAFTEKAKEQRALASAAKKAGR